MISYMRKKQWGTEGAVQRAALFFLVLPRTFPLVSQFIPTAIFIHGMNMNMCSDFTNTKTEEALTETTRTIAGKNSS